MSLLSLKSLLVLEILLDRYVGRSDMLYTTSVYLLIISMLSILPNHLMQRLRGYFSHQGYLQLPAKKTLYSFYDCHRATSCFILAMKNSLRRSWQKKSPHVKGWSGCFSQQAKAYLVKGIPFPENLCLVSILCFLTK